MLGISGGATQTLQPSLAAKVLWQTEDILEVSLGAQTRDLAVVTSPTMPTYGIQTSGATLGMGMKIANINFGAQVEAMLLRRLTSPAANQLTLGQVFAVMVEPYAGVYLANWLHVGVYYPVLLVPDPALGPRVMVTLFVPMND